MLCFSQYLLAEVSLSITPASAHRFFDEILTMSVNVEGIVAGFETDLRGFEVELVYDPLYLSIADEYSFQEGTYLSSHGQTQWYAREGSPGTYVISCALLGGITQGASGSGTLFTVDFQTLNKSTGTTGTDVQLQNSTLRGILNQDIIVDSSTAANVMIEEAVSLSIDPASTDLFCGQDITLSVKMDGLVTDMRGFEIELVYDHELLYEPDFQEGTFLSQHGQTQWYVLEGSAAGTYILSCALLGGVTHGATGSGTLFTVKFRARKQSPDIEVANINLPNNILRGILNQDIIVDQVTGATVQISTDTQTIDLRLGWNLVSSHLWPSDTDMMAVFSGLMTAGYLMKVQDESARTLVKIPAGGWANNLNSWDIREGYAVQVNTPCLWDIVGCRAPLPLIIPLQTGWNIISFPYISDLAAMPLLQSLIDADHLVKVQDEEGLTITKTPANIWANNIGNFKPGKGYKIYVNCDTQLVYSKLREGADVKLQENDNEMKNPNNKLKFEKK